MAIKQSALVAAMLAVNAGKQKSVTSTIRKTAYESGIGQTTLRRILNGHEPSNKTKAKLIAYLASANTKTKSAISQAYALIEKEGKTRRKKSVQQSVDNPLKFHKRMVKKYDKFKAKVKELQDNESVLLRLGFVYRNGEAELPSNGE